MELSGPSVSGALFCGRFYDDVAVKIGLEREYMSSTSI
jgi:hypothetical protein